jgi:hypothetical protein
MIHPLEARMTDVVLDNLPDEVLATIEMRDAWFRRLPPAADGLEFVVADLHRWTPGQTVRVAFLGGESALHKDIAEATAPIAQSCSLTLDFGHDPQAGTYRTWATTDTEYAAEIRVSFDQAGFFSLVGTDSIAANIGARQGTVGGRPGQRSLNLGGFPVQRPANWQGVVRHEFLHALAFHHEHQNMRGPCEADFRWEDDAGYEQTTDAEGRFIADASGRRPGIYTYLAGFPNFWPKLKVDINLRTSNRPDVVAGSFDRKSVMLYRFPPIFYRTEQSQCFPAGDGIELSAGDKRGLALLYPGAGGGLEAVMERRRDLLGTVERMGGAPGGLESTAPSSSFAVAAGRSLRRSLGAV